MLCSVFIRLRGDAFHYLPVFFLHLSRSKSHFFCFKNLLPFSKFKLVRQKHFQRKGIIFFCKKNQNLKNKIAFRNRNIQMFRIVLCFPNGFHVSIQYCWIGLFLVFHECTCFQKHCTYKNSNSFCTTLLTLLLGNVSNKMSCSFQSNC